MGQVAGYAVPDQIRGSVLSIASSLVARQEWMLSAEITSYKPTYQDLASFLARCDSYRRNVRATLGLANPGYFRRKL
jgi:hypothetical protein